MLGLLYPCFPWQKQALMTKGHIHEKHSLLFFEKSNVNGCNMHTCMPTGKFFSLILLNELRIDD